MMKRSDEPWRRPIEIAHLPPLTARIVQTRITVRAPVPASGQDRGAPRRRRDGTLESC
jgi:hypothetical protein